MARRQYSKLELYANPYDYDAKGFYFSDLKDFEKKYKAEYRRHRTEEYEIELIDSSAPVAAEIFDAMKVNPANLAEFFDAVEHTETLDSAQGGSLQRNTRKSSSVVIHPDDLIAFIDSYIETALWSSTDLDTDTPLDQDFTSDDLSPEAIVVARKDATEFISKMDKYIRGEYARAGHDFWLTRNGHGAGFWDGDWPEPAATKLTDESHAMGEIYLYPGDDGLLYFSR